jgi:hypothetical protein
MYGTLVNMGNRYVAAGLGWRDDYWYFFCSRAASPGMDLSQTWIPLYIVDQVSGHLCAKVQRHGERVIGVQHP